MLEVADGPRGSVVCWSLRVDQGEQLLGQDLVVERRELESREQRDSLSTGHTQGADPIVFMALFASHAFIEAMFAAVTTRSRWARGLIWMADSTTQPTRDGAKSRRLEEESDPRYHSRVFNRSSVAEERFVSQGTVARNHTDRSGCL